MVGGPKMGDGAVRTLGQASLSEQVRAEWALGFANQSVLLRDQGQDGAQRQLVHRLSSPPKATALPLHTSSHPQAQQEP